MHHILDIDNDDLSAYTLDYHFNVGEYVSYRRLFQQSFGASFPLVIKYQLNKLSSISTDYFYNLKQKNISSHIDTNLYPIAVRYVSADKVYFIERPPCQIDVDFRMGTGHSGAQKLPSFKIWVPWTLTKLDLSSIDSETLSKTCLYFNDRPIYSMDDDLIPCDLPNSYSNGSICFSNSMIDFGSILDNDSLISSDVNYIYNYVFNNYMMGGWNSDLTPVFYSYDNSNVDIDDLPMLKEYMNPSPERKARALAPFQDTSYAVSLKRTLNSKSRINNSRSIARSYLRDLALRSTFTLEETLQYVSDIKAFYSRFSSLYKNQSYYSRSNSRCFSSLISTSSSPKDNFNYSRYLYNSLLNSVIKNGDTSEIQYYHDHFSGYIVIDLPDDSDINVYHRPVNLSLVIGSENAYNLQREIIDSYKNKDSKKNYIFTHDGNTHSMRISHEHISDDLHPYFENFINNYRQHIIDTKHREGNLLLQQVGIRSLISSLVGCYFIPANS